VRLHVGMTWEFKEGILRIDYNLPTKRSVVSQSLLSVSSKPGTLWFSTEHYGFVIMYYATSRQV